MHEGAYLFVAGVVAQLRPRRVVIELGSRTVAGDWPYSGPVRPLFGEVLRYIGVDMMPGPNVDVVGNAATVHPYGGPVDTVVCCETFEHTFEAEQICANAHSLRRRAGCSSAPPPGRAAPRTRRPTAARCGGCAVRADRGEHQGVLPQRHP